MIRVSGDTSAIATHATRGIICPVNSPSSVNATVMLYDSRIENS